MTHSERCYAGVVRCRLAGLTTQEVAERLGITSQAVRDGERRALAKLRRHPVIRRLAREAGVLPEEEG